MANFKVIVCVVLLAGVVSGSLLLPKEAEQRDDKHNIDRCTDDDPSTWKILLSKTEIVDGKFLKVQKRTVHFPEFLRLDGETILCIKVTDLVGDGTGGYPAVINGGLGFKHVTITLTSQKSRGFEFAVNIWGKVV